MPLSSSGVRLPSMVVASNGTLICFEETCKGKHAGKQGMKPGFTQAKTVATHMRKQHFYVPQQQLQDFIRSYKDACLHYGRLAGEQAEHGPMRGPSSPLLRNLIGGGLVKMYRCPYKQSSGGLCGQLILKDVGNQVEYKSLYRHLSISHKADLTQRQEVCFSCCRLSFALPSFRCSSL